MDLFVHAAKQQIFPDDIATHHLIFLVEHYNPDQLLSTMPFGAPL
jgi:hypothetical protein